jgi:hypothetical protein
MLAKIMSGYPVMTMMAVMACVMIAPIQAT